MNTDELCGDVRQVVAQVLHMEESDIGDVELLSSYGLTSIDFLDILAKLEQKFHVPFEPEQMKNLTCRRLAENIEAGIAGK